MKRELVADPQIGDTPASCRKDSRGDFVTMADAIEALIAPTGLTAVQISQTLFANECECERIDLMCRRLIAEGRIKRWRRDYRQPIRIRAKTGNTILTAGRG